MQTRVSPFANQRGVGDLFFVDKGKPNRIETPDRVHAAFPRKDINWTSWEESVWLCDLGLEVLGAHF